MKSPNVPISWGELFDKLTILQIKLEKLETKNALENVQKEYSELNKVFHKSFSENTKAIKLMTNLKLVNKKLWDIEDNIREKEKSKNFDEYFVELSRSVYLTNDKRSRIKRRINIFLDSELIEEKSYTDY